MPAAEHRELLVQLLHDSGDAGARSGEELDAEHGRVSSGDDAAAGSGLPESVWLQRHESGEKSSGKGDAQEESGDESGSQGELSYAASDQVRSQLAGLRRKGRLR